MLLQSSVGWECPFYKELLVLRLGREGGGGEVGRKRLKLGRRRKKSH